MRLGIMISGSGTTLQSVMDNIQNGHLNSQIALVISNKSDAYGLVRAQNSKIPTLVVETAKKDPKVYSEEIYSAFQENQVDLVVMAGFLRKYLPPSYEIPVINIHPSLLPAFGGKGMYGHHVHQAVKDYGCKVSGCTVHYVTEEYDTGPIIAQKTIEISHADRTEDIEQRVQALEKETLLQVLQKFSSNKITLQGRTVTVLP